MNWSSDWGRFSHENNICRILRPEDYFSILSLTPCECSLITSCGHLLWLSGDRLASFDWTVPQWHTFIISIIIFLLPLVQHHHHHLDSVRARPSLVIHLEHLFLHCVFWNQMFLSVLAGNYNIYVDTDISLTTKYWLIILTNRYRSGSTL